MSFIEDLKEPAADGSDTAGVAAVWPWTWTGIGWMVGAFAALTALFSVAGFMVVEWFAPSSLGQAELELSQDLANNRTETWNTVAKIASVPSDTLVKVGLVAVLAIVLPGIWRRWHDWAFLVSALLLEVGVYAVAGFIVGRPRPPVERLSSAPTQSFPSGHVAAALVFYFAIAMIIAWHTQSQWLERLAYAIAAIITAAMFGSRLYLGMHYVSDMIASLVLGPLVLVITLELMRRSLAEKRGDAENSWPRRARSLDQA